MDLRDFYRLILRNLPLVLSSTLLGLIASAAITYSMTPMYQAKVQLFVSTPSSALDVSALVQGSSFSQQRVKSYAQIVNGPETLKPVILALKLKDSYEQLSKRVSATAPLDTVLISITVTDKNPYLAARIANAIGQQFSITANGLEASQSESAAAIKVSLVKTASLPGAPSSPNTALNLLLGLLLGFGLGISLSTLKIIFDNTIKNEDNLDGTAVLVAIQFDESALVNPLISNISRYAPRTESFRQLRTNLQYVRPESPPKVIAISSAVPGEGKTSTSINLALSMASSGVKTFLIEADMRRPKFQEYLKIAEKRPGLSEILSGKTQGDLATRVAQNSFAWGETTLTVLTSGATPPNPTELLDSGTFKELLNFARENFDFVIIDCPPTLLVADASVIAVNSDGAVIVTKVAKTRINQFLGARENLNSVGAVVLGSILNMVPKSRTEEYGRKYGYGYGYGYRKYGYRKYGSYGRYGKYASEPGYDPEHSYAPQDIANKIENSKQN